jgi:acyl-CoA synthetase (AMP-forming)/AMP-acid ligase II
MIFRSPLPDISVPETPLTPFVFERARERGDKTALVCAATGQSFTYAELAEAVRRAAAALASRGFARGDVLAILSPNTPEYAVAFHAAALVGGTVTTVNPLCTAEEIAKQLKDAGATRLVAHPALLDKGAQAASASGVACELFVFGRDGAGGAEAFAKLYEGGASALDPRDAAGAGGAAGIDPRADVVALPYSSGTTGLPKGVMLTHRNLVAQLRQLEQLDVLNASDTSLCVLPLFHIYGLVAILNIGLRAGATIVTMPRFDLEDYLKHLHDFRVTVAQVVPPIMLALVKSPSTAGRDLSSLRMVFSGAAPLGAGLSEECERRLGCVVRQGYGMTETSPSTHLTPADPALARHGSVGVPVPSTECKLVDAQTGAELGPNEEGELCVRGPQVMKGYLNRPDATAETIDAEGWLHTGDIGYADRDGHFFIVDRSKELIKYKGFQVAPAELEALLITHPLVADAAVVPCPDDEAGEIPKAFVVLKRDAAGGGDGGDSGDGGDEHARDAARAEELISFVAARVAPHKKVRRVEFIDKIPKSPSGKILRRLLKGK